MDSGLSLATIHLEYGDLGHLLWDMDLAARHAAKAYSVDLENAQTQLHSLEESLVLETTTKKKRVS